MIQQSGDENTNNTVSRPLDREWAIILAGGDGTRLKSLTRKIAGDERPKQFCSVLGRATLLEETQRRAALELPEERTLYIVNQAHEPFYAPILADKRPANLVVQPRNAGTAPAILYGLLRIAAADPQAVVALFPSDHYISDNRKFMNHIRTALDTARVRRDVVILLGVEPESPEVEYGWIEPTLPAKGNAKVSGVRRFWEKPNQVLAQVLQLRGCLWNSFVMVASVQALLDIIESALPGFYRAFACLNPLIRHSGRGRSSDRALPKPGGDQFFSSSARATAAAARGSQSQRSQVERPRRAEARPGVARLGRHPSSLGR